MPRDRGIGLFGGTGRDECLDARDGKRGNDVVHGGPGADGYRADREDVVTSAGAGNGCPTETLTQ